MRYLALFLLLSLARVGQAQLTVPAGRGGTVLRVPLQKPKAGVLTVTLRRIPIRVQFQLASAARTSVGVYAKTSGALIKTIWSNRQTPAGTVSVLWRGDDDFGNSAPTGDYEFQLLSSNTAYQWMGVLGNTSTDINAQSTMQRGFKRVQAMVGVGSRMYYGNGYAEGHPAQAYFTLTQPQKRLEFFRDTKTGQSTRMMATDGVRVYAAGYDLFSPKKRVNFIFAWNVSDNSQITFSSGRTIATAEGQSWGETYNSAIFADTVGMPSNTDLYKGLAVQKAGNFLFASHGIENRIRVYNKLTGAMVNTINLTSPGALVVDGANDNALWVVSGTTVTKRPINGDGSLGTATLTLTNLGKPMALAVSPDNATLAVCDGDTAQKVKGYNASSGALSWSIGVKGGYYNDPVVSTSKFYFDDVSKGINDTYIAYASDGSFWVGDSGNYRSLHFSTARSYIEQIAYLENCYTTAVDQNDATRLFAQYLEFSVSDYDNPTTAWSLVRNYRATVPSEYFENEYNRMQNIFITNVFRDAVTVSGHTYALLQRFTDKQLAVVELLPNAPLRFTGIVLSNGPWVLGKDGSLSIQQINWLTSTCTWKRQALSSIDGSGNPVWGTQTTLLSASIGPNDPIDESGFGKPFGITTSGRLVTFNSNLFDLSNGRGLGYHLGGYQNNQRVWGSHMATSKDYKGPYPTDGAYDIGNGVNYAGGNAPVVGNHIFPTYHGENWQNGQVNKFTHWYENGLLVGNFGVTQAEATADPLTYRGMAGNVFGATGVQSSNGNIYLVHGEEFGWSGLHIWRVSGLNTLQIQTITATLSNEPDPRGVPLFGALPKNAVLVNNQNGVVRNPATDGLYSVRTNAYTYSRTEAPDLFMENYNSVGDRSVKVTFNTATGLTGWNVSFTLQATQYYPSVGEYGEAKSAGGYIRILDNTGKTLLQYSQKIVGSNTVVAVNGTTVATIAGNTLPRYVPVQISASGSSISFTYGNYAPVSVGKFDAGATLSAPGAIEIFSWIQQADGNTTGRIYDISNAWFKASLPNP